MKPVCQQAINTAAGRELSKGELDAIEQSILGSLRELQRQDPVKFQGMSQADRMVEAAKIAKEKMLESVVRAHEATIVEAGRKADLFRYVDSIKPGQKGQVHGLKNLISTVETKVDAMSAGFFSMVRGLHELDGGKLFGMLLDPRAQKDIRAAIFGEQSSPEAARVAKSLNEMNNALADRFQRAGIPLDAREDYRTPQPQDPTKVAGHGRDAWVQDHMNWVDRDKYVNPDGTSMSEDQLRKMLEQSYRSIATDGANKRAEAESLGGSNMVGRNKNAPRQLFFKDSASWGAAMEKYGRSANIYELMSQHVRGMSKDIVLAETFGRNADANVQQAMARAFENDLNAGANKGKLDTLQNTTKRYYDGIVHPDRPGNERAANLGVQIRGLIGSTQLGSLVGALPDLAGMKMASELNGLPFFRMFRNFVDGIASGSEKQDFLHKLGVWQEGFQHATNRMGVDEFKNGWGTWLNEATHRLMGLNAFDRGMRVGIGRTVMDTLGSFTRRFSTLAEAEGESKLLQREHGVTEDHWQVWKAAEVDTGRGNENLLTPDAIRAIPDAKLDPIVEQLVAARSEIFKAEINRRNERNQVEQGWLQSRADKIRAAKDKAAAWLDELRTRRSQRVGDAAELENVRALVLSNMLRQLEVRHDFLAANATDAHRTAISNIITSVEDGADPAPLAKKTNSQIQDYGRAVNAGGEGLGKLQAQIEASIKDGQKRIAELEKSLDLKTDAHEKANAEKFKARMEELQAFAQELKERAEKRSEYADAFQKKLGKVLEEERANLRDEAMEKLLEVAYSQMQFGARGASRSSIGDRVAMGLDSSKTAGTISGEFNRFALQFKSVPLGIFRSHYEAMQSLDTWGSKAAYGAKFVGYSTLMGALAVELKAMINGQNPRTMNIATEEGKKFWMESLAAGGGFGLYGDLFANGQTKAGAGAEVLLGPGISAGMNVINELGQARNEVMNEGASSKHKYSLAATRWVRKNATPFANIWYAKAAFNRLVYDQLQEQLSPGSSMRQQRRMEKRGASYWWAPGTVAPQSAPDLSKMTESR